MAEDDANGVGAPPQLAALEEYEFTVKHRPGKAQTHVDGLSQLPVDPAPPEDVLLHICLLENEEEVRKLVKELHSATHLGRQALWKLFRDRYDFRAGRRICLEVAQNCPQCQMASDYGHRQKTTEAIQSRGPWDTLLIDIVGPLSTRSSSSCLWTATQGTPSSSPLATTPQTRRAGPSFGTWSPTSAHHADFSLTEDENS